jgi:hypothetical protein
VSRTAVRASGLPGDQVELVAFDVGEGRPAGLVSLDIAEPAGAQARSDGGAAAVGGDDRAGDVAGLGGGEEGDETGDLAGLGGPGQQGRGPEGLDALAGRPPVRTGPAATALTRTPKGVNSAAQERVIAARVALVAL